MVASYGADAQIAYLVKHGYADIAISEVKMIKSGHL